MSDKSIPAFEFLERVLGIQVAMVLRWLLFLPLSLVIGVGVFGLFVLGAANSGDEDVAAFGGLVAGVIGGICSVLAGIVIAPSHTRAVAVITATAGVALAGMFVQWARSSHQGEFFVASIIAGGSYSVSAVTLAVSAVWRYREERNR
jgi:hypothetical protein